MVYLIINWVLSVVGLIVVTFFVPGFRVLDFGSVLIAAGIVGLVSALISLGVRHAGAITLVLSISLLGIFNTFFFRLMGLLIPGFAMTGFVPAIAGAVALLLVNITTIRYASSMRERFDWEPDLTIEERPAISEVAATRERARTNFRKLASSNR